MQEDINKDISYRNKIYTPSSRYCLQRRGYSYLQLLAKDVGCLPPTNISLWLTDPRLAYKLWFGVLSATQYRLVGPNKWCHSRKVILDLWRRVEAPYGIVAASNRAKDAILYENKLALIMLFILGCSLLYIGYISLYVFCLFD